VRVPWGLVGVLAARLAAAEPVEVEVKGLGVDSESGAPVVRLVEKVPAAGAAARELPIWIGPFEAQAIALELNGVPSERPLTHDLMKRIVERLGGTLTRVVVDDLRGSTYIATLHFDGPGGKNLTVDARPSDAIALALRLRGPILVREEVFTKSAGARPVPAAAHIWGLTLQDLTPEIAAFFEVPAAEGVLVADVEVSAPARAVERGDVITALDGERVTSVRELTTRAGTRRAAEPVHLSVRRAGQRLDLRFESPAPAADR
jgi:hypothetical protein